jgi:hypothetical protein
MGIDGAMLAPRCAHELRRVDGYRWGDARLSIIVDQDMNRCYVLIL